MPVAPHVRVLAFCALVSCALSVAAGALDLGIDDPDIKDCMARTLPQKAMTQKLTLRLFNGTELINTSGAELFWKRSEAGRSKVIIRMTAPPERAGIAVLAIEREGSDPELSVYLPESRKARRVAGKTIDASMFGTDFSYEDFAYFQGLATENKTTRLADQTLEGMQNFVLETVPSGEGSKYSRIVSYINREQCALSKIEFFAKNGTLLKDLVVPHEDVRQIGARWIPHHVILNDHKRESRTELIVEEINIDPELAENFFSATKFGAGK